MMGLRSHLYKAREVPIRYRISGWLLSSGYFRRGGSTRTTVGRCVPCVTRDCSMRPTSSSRERYCFHDMRLTENSSATSVEFRVTVPSDVMHPKRATQMENARARTDGEYSSAASTNCHAR